MTATLTIVSDPSLAALRWAPPAQNSPTVITVPDGFYSGTFAANQDVIFNWPADARFSEFICSGGRHVRIIGGSSAKGAGGSAIQVINTSGSIFMEGLLLDVSGSDIDAINACGSQDGSATFQPDVYIQNCRILGLNGSNATNHSDAYQAQGAIRNLYVDRVTLTSNHQGISLFQNQFPTGRALISRVNGSYLPGGDAFSSLMWNMDQTTHAPYAPVFLDEVYFVPRAGQSLGDCAWPQPPITNSDGLPIGMVVSPDGKTGSWPAITNCHGMVHLGPPPGGDWCTSGVPGLSYVSPGFQALAGVIA